MNILKKLVSGKKNVLVVGAAGMLGQEVFSYLKQESMRTDSSIRNVWGLTRKDLCLSSYEDVSDWFSNPSHIKPDIVVNCVGFTDTKACQDNNSGTAMSYYANALIPKVLAVTCAHHKIKLIHISTDYVFSEQDSSLIVFTFPCNVYGTHKLLGEQFIKEAYAYDTTGYAILRTSWLFGPSAKKPTFIHKLLLAGYKQMIASNGKAADLHVTDTCLGRPTSVWFLSSFISNIIELGLHGTMDAQQLNDDGSEFPVSRFAWAKEIVSYWQQKTKDLDCLEVKPLDLTDPYVPPAEVRHPEHVPELMRIDPYWQFKDYRLALGDAVDAKLQSSSWKLHTQKFIDLQQHEIMSWIKSQLSLDQIKILESLQSSKSHTAAPD